MCVHVCVQVCLCECTCVGIRVCICVCSVQCVRVHVRVCAMPAALSLSLRPQSPVARSAASGPLPEPQTVFSAQPGGPSRGWDRSSLAGHRPLLPAGGAVTLQPSGGGGARGPSRAVTPRPLLSLQEVLLKRAADLVEALYGMPHNNQVGGAAARQPLPGLAGGPARLAPQAGAGALPLHTCPLTPRGRGSGTGRCHRKGPLRNPPRGGHPRPSPPRRGPGPCPRARSSRVRRRPLRPGRVGQARRPVRLEPASREELFPVSS